MREVGEVNKDGEGHPLLRNLQLRRGQAILFGDSLTQFSFQQSDGGWALALADWWGAKVDVLNRGFSGYTTRLALQLLPVVFPKRQSPNVTPAPPLLVTVLWGANDSSVPSHSQHIPLEEYEANLVKIVEHIRASAAEGEQIEIIVITPPPVEEELWLKSSIARGRGGTSSNRLNHITKTYAAASRRVAEKCGVHCVDLYEAITSAAASGSGGKGKGKGDGEKEKETETEKGKEGEVKEGLGRYLNDGLHLSAEGNAVLVKRIKKLVRLKIPALDGDKLDFDFPNWSALFQ